MTQELSEAEAVQVAAFGLDKPPATAGDAIAAILAEIPDHELPQPTRIEVNPDGTRTAWFGGLGHVLGTARSGGVRDPLLHRRGGIRDALQQEAVYRLDLASLAEESRS
jgi:hypothetical protein